MNRDQGFFPRGETIYGPTQPPLWYKTWNKHCIRYEYGALDKTKHYYVCFYCQNARVNQLADICKKCTKLYPSNPLADIACTQWIDAVAFKGIPFYRGNAVIDDKMTAEVALFYAHMRAEHLQARVDALESTVKEMKQTLGDFIAGCELTPDGPVAADIVERTLKMFKKNE